MFRRNKGAEAKDAAESRDRGEGRVRPDGGTLGRQRDRPRGRVERVDLGGLLLAPSPGHELRLQVDEATQQVQSVLIAGAEGAVELRPFAAPRNGDLWDEIRPQIAEDMAAQRRQGRGARRCTRHRARRLGPGAGGRGQDGRAALADRRRQRPAVAAASHVPRFAGDQSRRGQDWEAVLGSVIVRRGSHAMPVGDPLPLTLPPQARKQV